jgi:phosphohistidine phosphatase
VSVTLYIFRHGEAYQIGERGIETDDERPLTPKGKSVTADVCAGLRKLGVSGDLIWHSPLVRAAETAEIIRTDLAVPQMEEKRGLAFVSDAEDLFLSLAKLPPDMNLFVVGHQPQLGDWVARLAAGASAGDISFSKSGVAKVDLISLDTPPRGELRWMLTAKILRKLR